MNHPKNDLKKLSRKKGNAYQVPTIWNLVDFTEQTSYSFFIISDSALQLDFTSYNRINSEQKSQEECESQLGLSRRNNFI